MGASAALSSSALVVTPGEEVVVELTVRNTGTVVDAFTLEVLGPAAGLAAIEPNALSLFPDATETVLVRFAVTRSPQNKAAVLPFGVRVTSREDVERSVVEEGTLEVTAYTQLSGEVTPRTSRGSRRAQHDVAIDNRGNVDVQARMLPADPDGALTFEVNPPVLIIPAGTATFAAVRALPRKRFSRGAPKTLPFTVLVEPDVGDPLPLDATMVQEATVPRWLPRALIGLLVLLLLLTGLWFGLVRPTVESLARDVAAEELEELAASQSEIAMQVSEAGVAASEASEAAVAASEAAGGAAAEAGGEGAGEEAGAGASEPGADGAGADAAGAGVDPGEQAAIDELQDQLAAERAVFGPPFDFRLARAVNPGTTASVSQAIPAGQLFSLTDVVLQNPQGDMGRLQVKRGNQQVLLEVRLENFRDLDYHFVSPILFPSGQDVVLTVICENAPPTPCNAATYFAGNQTLPPTTAPAAPVAVATPSP